MNLTFLNTPAFSCINKPTGSKMKNILLCSIACISFSIAQNSNIEVDGNSSLEIFIGSKICVDEISLMSGSSLWAYDYGQIKESDCTVILTPTGNGNITLPVEIDESESLPTKFEIEKVFPNPFNPVTNIKYGIPAGSAVKIVIYNIQGHLVKILYDDYQEAGWYTITWDGSLGDGTIAPAGVYLMKIINTSNKITNFKSIKISLVK